MIRRRLGAWGGALVAVVTALPACSATNTQAGLEVIVETDLPPSAYSSLWIQVSQNVGAGTFKQLAYEPLEVTVPARFAIGAGASEDQDVLVTVTAFAGTGTDGGPSMPVARRTVQAVVPKSYVAVLDVDLSPFAAACPGVFAVGVPDAGTPPTCTIDLADAGPLPAWIPGTNSFDAGTVDATAPDSGAPADAGRDVEVAQDAADASRPHDATLPVDGHPRDATMPTDAGRDGGGADAPGEDSGGTDAGTDTPEPTVPNLVLVNPPSGFSPVAGAAAEVAVTLTGTGFQHGSGFTVESSQTTVTIHQVHVDSDSSATATFTVAPGAGHTATPNITASTSKGSSLGVPFPLYSLLEVTSAGDALPTAPAGGLRAAIASSESGDRVQFACATGGYPDCLVQLVMPLPPITHDLIIDGVSYLTSTVSGSQTSNVFFVESGNVTIENLTIEGAVAQGGTGGTGFEFGGGGGGGLGAGAGIFVDGPLAAVTVSRVLFQNLTARGGNGGSASDVGADQGGGGGGGGLGVGLQVNGGNGSTAGGGGGGGGVLGNGADAPADGGLGGAGGAGGGGGGATSGDFVGAGPVAGGGAFVEDAGGQPGMVAGAGNGGFGGGGGGGGERATGGAGGFGGGGGGVGSADVAGGAGGPGGGGGAGCMGAGKGGELAPGISGGNGAYTMEMGLAGGGGGAAVGAAIFVRAGQLGISGSAATGIVAKGGQVGDVSVGTPMVQGTAGGADLNPIFNYAGKVNDAGAAGGVTLPDAMPPDAG